MKLTIETSLTSPVTVDTSTSERSSGSGMSELVLRVLRPSLNVNGMQLAPYGEPDASGRFVLYAVLGAAVLGAGLIAVRLIRSR